MGTFYLLPPNQDSPWPPSSQAPLWVLCLPRSRPWALSLAHWVSLARILHPWYVIRLLMSHPRCLVTLACLQQGESVSCSVLFDSLWPQGLSMDCNSVHGILQARILEWVAFPFSRGSSWPRDRTRVSGTAGGFFTVCATRRSPVSSEGFVKCYLTRIPFPLGPLWLSIHQSSPCFIVSKSLLSLRCGWVCSPSPTANSH